jgi:hypothetical protein
MLQFSYRSKEVSILYLVNSFVRDWNWFYLQFVYSSALMGHSSYEVTLEWFFGFSQFLKYAVKNQQSFRKIWGFMQLHKNYAPLVHLNKQTVNKINSNLSQNCLLGIKYWLLSICMKIVTSWRDYQVFECQTTRNL